MGAVVESSSCADTVAVILFSRHVEFSSKKGGIWDEARRRIQDGGWSGGFQSDGISALKIWLEQAFPKFGVLETCEGIFEEGTDNIYFAYNDLSLFIVSLRCIKSADMDSTCKCFLLYIHIS